MTSTYWRKQNAKEPLFPDLVWSRPENKNQAGKLLIIGGNLHGFAAPANAYKVAENAGIGTVRMILPDSLKQYTGNMFESGRFAPSTPSGSFAQSSLDTFLEEATWADGVLLAGDFGRNSETSILLEKFIVEHKGIVILTHEGEDLLQSTPDTFINRTDTSLVVSLGQLQKLFSALKFPKSISLGMDFIRLIDVLSEFTQKYGVHILTKQHNQILIASKGQVVSTKLETDKEFWRVEMAATASVWWIQNPKKPLEGLATAVANPASTEPVH
jgi:ADP-dependent NAD(P)H-hydrate dehydratase / NAD(P)H-hydrate epimerase